MEKIMRQPTEAQQNEPTNSVLCAGKNTSEAATLNATVYVYGHGPNKNPFYEAAQAVNGTDKGALLILNSAVSRGQKLLLMNGTRQDPVEDQVVRTRTMGAQMFEVEVAFPVSLPDFWRPFCGAAKGKQGAERRRFPRIELRCGGTGAWQATHHKDIPRTSSLSLRGLCIEPANPAPPAQPVQWPFDLPSGAVRSQ